MGSRAETYISVWPDRTDAMSKQNYALRQEWLQCGDAFQPSDYDYPQAPTNEVDGEVFMEATGELMQVRR